mgnify:FL=1
MIRLLPAAVLLLATVACGGPTDRPPRDAAAGLSRFAVDTVLSGAIVENVTACEVDAVCFLRVQLADSVIVAVYGTGERPAPPCDISVDASDAAWGLSAGDPVEIVVFPCGDEGLFVRDVRPRDP